MRNLPTCVITAVIMSALGTPEHSAGHQKFQRTRTWTKRLFCPVRLSCYVRVSEMCSCFPFKVLLGSGTRIYVGGYIGGYGVRPGSNVKRRTSYPDQLGLTVGLNVELIPSK